MAELPSALACAERLYMILDEKKVVETGKEELTSEAVRGAIHFEHVRFGYEPNELPGCSTPRYIVMISA